MSLLKSLKTVLQHPYNRGREVQALFVTIWWKCNQLFFHLQTIKQIAPGVKIICEPSSSYGSFIVYATWPEYAELKFTYDFLQKNDIYIDVGAHIGDSSLLAASKISKGKVIACEPTPDVFNQLKSNIALNVFENKIVAIQKAISHKKGTAFFSLETDSEVNHLQTARKGKKSIKVATTTIDSLVKQFSLKNITLLKIDVEGFEWEVIQGARESLKRNKIQMILFEVNPKSRFISEKIVKIQKELQKNSFSFYSFNENHRLTELSELFVPSQTTNFLAVSPDPKISARLRPWLK